jgi:predicted acetyltransferase/ADP-ribose pyrophosphatase YjhB (NUDIX family)
VTPAVSGPRVPLGSPEPRAAAVVVRGHKLLVIARLLDGREYAVLPGGGVDPGETPEEAAVRELAEECSMSGRAVRRLFDGDHGGRPASYVLVEAEGEPVLGGEEARAASPDDSYRPLWATEPELALLGLLPDGIAELVAAEVWALRVAEATADEWPVVERLWQLYQHDLSEFRHGAPDAGGLFPAGRLPAYRDSDDCVAYLARRGDVPCGFALVRLGVRRDRRTMGEFFVTRAARGRGVASDFARDVLARHPGEWVIAFQNENPRAATFWRRLAAETLDGVSERTLPVPDKPHLPPDVWMTGTMRGA